MSNVLKTFNTVAPLVAKAVEAKRNAPVNPNAVPQPSIHWMAPTGLALALIVPLAGLIFSIMATVKIHKGDFRGMGFSVVGISLSAVSLLGQVTFGGLFLLIVILGMNN